MVFECYQHKPTIVLTVEVYIKTLWNRIELAPSVCGLEYQSIALNTWESLLINNRRIVRPTITFTNVQLIELAQSK